MKKLLVILILLSGFPAMSQEICYGDVVLTTQEEVNNFTCEEVTGSLLITGTDIRSLTGLRSLKRVGEHLIIADAPNLGSTFGLDNLEEVVCSMEFKNTGLYDIMRPGNLPKLGRHLTVINNPNLDDISGLGVIKEVVDLKVFNNPMLNICCDLFPLTSEGGATGSVQIYGNGPDCVLESILACELTGTVCYGDVYLHTQAEVDAFNCSIITGNLTIDNTDNTLDLENLATLTQVNGNLTMRFEDDVDLTGLRNLEEIGGIFDFNTPTGGSPRYNTDALLSLNSIGGLRVGFAYLDGTIPQLDPVLDELSILFVSSDFTVESLDMVETINKVEFAYFEFSDKGLLERVPEGGEVTLLSDIDDLTGLSGINYLKSFEIQFTSIVSLDGLESLTDVDNFNISNSNFGTDNCGIYNFLINRDPGDTFIWEGNTLTPADIISECTPLVAVEVSVYPNPSPFNEVYVEWNPIREVMSTIEVVDSFGKVVMAEEVDGKNVNSIRKRLSISSLDQGIYLIRVTTGKDTQITRFIKN